MAGGVGVIRVGAATEVELKEKKLRIEDALNATRVAVEEGIVPGGGLALLRSVKALEHLKSDNEDESIGINIVRRVLSSPLAQIATNAKGTSSHNVVADLDGMEEGIGYDASKDEFVDMVKAGIIDPKKVVRSAIQNAASVAAIFLTMESAVCDIPEEKKDEPSMHGGMPGMM